LPRRRLRNPSARLHLRAFNHDNDSSGTNRSRPIGRRPDRRGAVYQRGDGVGPKGACADSRTAATPAVVRGGRTRRLAYTATHVGSRVRVASALTFSGARQPSRERRKARWDGDRGLPRAARIHTRPPSAPVGAHDRKCARAKPARHRTGVRLNRVSRCAREPVAASADISVNRLRMNRISQAEH